MTPASPPFTSPYSLRVKICGTTSLHDALLSAGAGADAVGLIFASISRRRVAAEVAREISLAVGPAVGRVGVFMDQGLDEVLRTAEASRLSAVQIHGEVSSLYLSTLACYYPVLRVLRPAELAGQSTSPGGDQTPTIQPRGLADHTLMLDAPNPGSGQPLDWESLRASFPAGAWLAGGLGPENVARAIQVLRPGGVDAVSGLENSPGVKNPGRVRDFVREARKAALLAFPESYPQ
ncbi:phosphoribosylanthranilate isomerase [Deinococcus radiomollis]|uniref:phosphoribosylanthranilate isomerase n=1 Tax=Deinococcus radiomollis TaxID=468916 RepID=UPI00389209A3